MNNRKILLSIVLLSLYSCTFAMQGADSSSMMGKNAESMLGYWSLSELEELFRTVKDARLRRSVISKALESKKQELENQHLSDGETLSITPDEIEIILAIYEQYGDTQSEADQLYAKVYQSASDLLEFLLSKKILLSEEAFDSLKEEYESRE